MFQQTVLTPLGPILIRSDGEAITEILFSEGASDCPDPLTEAAVRQIGEYFSGTRREFCLPLRLSGTPFEQAVYRALLQIPYGKTASYGQLASQAGHPGAARAVGSAMRKNPLVLVVPCHRVLAKDGLGGYSCGLWRKRRLLQLENADFSEK